MGIDTLKHLSTRLDEWLLGRSQGEYAVFLGLSVGVGALIVGLLLSGEFLLIRAFTMAFVMFSLEYVFGQHQPTEED